MVCAVVLPLRCAIEGVNDSKKLTERRRKICAEVIKTQAVTYHIASRSPKQIDQHGILQMTLIAMREAVQSCHFALNGQDVVAFVDGNVSIPDLGLRRSH